MERATTLAQRIATRWHVFTAREDGASMVEYALLIALIALVAIAGVVFFGSSLSDSFDDIGTSVTDAT